MTQKRYFINAFGNIEPIEITETDSPDRVEIAHPTCFIHETIINAYGEVRYLVNKTNANKAFIEKHTYNSYEEALKAKSWLITNDISLALYRPLDELEANQLTAFIEVAESELDYLKTKLEGKLGN